ncbi:LysM peptidoglycan-binding domain-containing protein [Brevibacterium sp. CFH 10365]|uniref:LysM peptidoglycan-binding domain-containing protein n=1 Tax=Brevibacterium sp. CFH 10365 TaxID=2585207 RepID=UPI0012664742|nr:hypothetical protein [Brevibacterium sp. CFH 10365]
MYLLIACAGSWLVLLGSFFTAWTQLPQPRTTSDIVVIVIIGAAALMFARLGLVSLLALLLRVLPSGRLRARLAGLVVKVMPRILASSVLAIVSAGLVVHSAQAAPVGPPGPDTSPTEASAAPADPGWPTVDDDGRGEDSPDRAEQTDGAGSPAGSESPDRAQLPDPGWPTEPPSGDVPSSPPGDRGADRSGDSAQDDESDHGGRPDEPGDGADASVPAGSRSSAHVVTQGESLWSIAAELTDAPEEIPQLVADIYTANEDTIGPDPSLIIAGQRLEIQT